MSQPLGKASGDAGQSRATTPKCSKENSEGHSLILEKAVDLEDNEMQESQKNALNPFCPGSSSRWVWELMGCGIHHGNVDLWGGLSQPGGFNLSPLPSAGGDPWQAFALCLPTGVCSSSPSLPVEPSSPGLLLSWVCHCSVLRAAGAKMNWQGHKSILGSPHSFPPLHLSPALCR